MSTIRHDWKADEVRALFDRPLMDLVHTAQTLHRQHHPEDEVQLCTLMSIKTGGCAEDCGYCPQSAHFKTGAGSHGDKKKANSKKACRGRVATS